MRNFAAIAALAAAVFAGCESPPIQVMPMPDVAAVRVQNVETQKSIAKTRYYHKRWRKHADAAEVQESAADDKLQSVKKDLEELLGIRETSAQPTSTVTPSPTATATPLP